MPLLSKFLETTTSSVSPYLEPLVPYIKPVGAWATENPRVAVTVSVAVAASTLYVLQRLRAPRLPPGPMPLPIVGNALSLSEQMHLDIERIRKKYGDLFTLYIGNTPFIIAASYDVYKEIFLTRDKDFASRPITSVYNSDLIDDEILFSPFLSENWAKDKKFLYTTIRNLTGVKAGINGSLVTAISTMILELRKMDGQSVDMKEICMLTATNAMSGMMFNEQFDHDDPKLTRLAELVSTWQGAINNLGMSAFMVPGWLCKLLERSKFAAFNKAMADLQEFVTEQVKEHLKTYDPQHPRDLVDMYLGKPGIQVGRRLYQSLIALMPDSSETTAVFMSWVVLYVTLHPEVLKKLQTEIDAIVAPNEMVTIEHRSKLAYTEAVLLEVMRCSDGSNNSTPHCATYPGMKLRGYDVPMDAQIMASIYAVHKDPELFPDPEKFNPERFLDGSGKVVNANLVVPWSMGRRMCPGESYSKTELFLFLANVVHTFNMSFPADEPHPTTEPLPTLIQKPQPYKVIFTARE